MKTILIISNVLIVLLACLLMYQFMGLLFLNDKQIYKRQEIESYEVLINDLLLSKDKQIETLKAELSSNFTFDDVVEQYSNGTYGFVIRRKNQFALKGGLFPGLELLFNKDNQLISVKTNTFNE